MKERSREKELIDIGAYSSEEYLDCLKKMHYVGKYFGGDRPSLKAFRSLAYVPDSILEVGCGGGYFSKTLALAFPQTRVSGVDLSEAAIRFAKRTHLPRPSNLSFVLQRNTRLSSFEPVDILTSTMVCHHMTDDELVEFLRQAVQVARKEVILNDLHRSKVAYAVFSLTAPLTLRNRLVSHDGPLSIQRSFLREDWERALEKAGIERNRYSIEWYFPYRWLVRIRCGK